ncbi:MAG: hypothetical protein IJA11_06570 [Oscillospiraceae bacterium]|nr:hypothetical protein [Oscillospiraceae bacterium]
MTEWQMKDGDLIPNGAGGFELVHGEQALLQRVLFKLTARRGAFPFLPELGSKLHTLCREKPGARRSLCAQYVAQALEGEEVTVKEVVYTESKGRAQVDVRLELQGHDATVSVPVGEVTDEDD